MIVEDCEQLYGQTKVLSWVYKLCTHQQCLLGCLAVLCLAQDQNHIRPFHRFLGITGAVLQSNVSIRESLLTLCGHHCNQQHMLQV